MAVFLCQDRFTGIVLLPNAYNRPEIRYVWRGPAVLIVDPQGRCGETALTGFFFRETRYLNVLRLQVGGESPFPAGVGEVEPNVLELSFVYPEVKTRGGGGSGSGGSDRQNGILERGVDLGLRYTIRAASVRAELRITNRWDELVELDVAWQLDADFASISEAQGGEREQEAPVVAEPLANGVSFRYAHPELPLSTQVTVAGNEAWTFADGLLGTRLTLPRQQTALIQLDIRAIDSVDPIGEAGEHEREAHLEQWQTNLPHVHAPGETPFADLTKRALRDLGSFALLEGGRAEWLAPGAGYPLYAALFGRDALTASWQAAVLDHGKMADAALTALGQLQGTKPDEWRDEMPGRIVQQARRDPLSRLGHVPFDRYYGDYASPLMFVIALGNAYAWSGERDLLDRHWDHARRVLDWAEAHGDLDGDGYLEYETKSPKGPKHQGWKDSDNAVVHADGKQVDPPIASCEIQGYYYAALQFMSVFSAIQGERRTALDLWRRAASLKRRFNHDFWVEDGGFIAHGLDGDKQQIRSLTSNAGQCIATGILKRGHLPRLVRRLFEPDLFSGWGMRTLSTRNPAYNPLDYHLGTVWSVENGTIVFGLRRYGFNDRALELSRALYDLALMWPGGRVPECVGGYARHERAHPGVYPQANSPQAWNQSVWPIVMQSILGMYAVAPLQTLALDPVLPSWLPELELQNMRVGGAVVSLRFWRDTDGKSHFDVLRKSGTLHIIEQPPPESLTDGVRDRLRGLFRSLTPLGR